MLPSLRVLVLYDPASTYTATVLEHIRSFAMLPHEVVFAGGVRGTTLATPLDAFDVVIIHYSIRLIAEDYISPSVAQALPGFTGLKVLFIQDEYDETETARRWIERLGIGLVFTCVPEAYIDAVYPRARFPGTTFVQTLTGFVPAEYERPLDAPPMASRSLMLAYRGRELAVRYGLLAREKVEIGRRMKALCTERGVPVDIEWDEDKRVYGADWFRFLTSARATLATESGANVFDFHGDIKRAVQADQRAHPGLTWDELYQRHVAAHDGHIRMNQVSPRVFEAIAVGTGLVLFEGHYSGVLEPHRHYIPLAKDYSNVDEVLAKLADTAFMEALVRRAHEEIILSGRYSYRAAIQAVAAEIEKKARRVRTRELFTIVVGSMPDGARPTYDPKIMDAQLKSVITSIPLLLGEAETHVGAVMSAGHLLARGAWRALPNGLRIQLRPLLPQVRSVVRRLKP